MTYADGGDRWLGEEAPVDRPAFAATTADAEAAARRFTEAGGTGVVLRFAQFVAADSTHTLAAVGTARRASHHFLAIRPVTRRGSTPTTRPQPWWPPSAWRPARGTWPRTGRPLAPPRPMPWLEPSDGPGSARSRHHYSDWAARLPSCSVAPCECRTTAFRKLPAGRRRCGHRSTAGRRLPMRERTVRLALAVLAAASAVVGFWAGVAPRSFYDDFPGGGLNGLPSTGPSTSTSCGTSAR